MHLPQRLFQERVHKSLGHWQRAEEERAAACIAELKAQQAAAQRRRDEAEQVRVHVSSPR